MGPDTLHTAAGLATAGQTTTGQTAQGARARLVTGEGRVSDPALLAPEEQLLLINAVFRFEPLARTASEYEFTLKQMLTILGDLLQLDLAAFVDFDQETAYGVACSAGTTLLGDELTAEASAIFQPDSGLQRRLRNTVLWNRRQLRGDASPGGEWIAVRSQHSELVHGWYLFHTPQPLQISAAALAAICANAENCLVMPQLIQRNAQLHADMEQRYRAVREMISLFRQVDDPDFCLQYLLILLDFAKVDRGIFWELDGQGHLLKTHQIGLPPELAQRFSVDGEQLFWQQMLQSRQMVWLEEPLLLAKLPDPEGPPVPALDTQVCHTFLGFPLIGSDGVVGVVALLDADFPGLGGERFTQVMSDIAASYLDNSLRHRRLLLSRELEMQVSVARDIQMGLLPSESPQVPGFEVLALNTSAKELGGDFYHLYRNGDHLHATIGDVSGKGVPAGLLMAGSRFLMQAAQRLQLSNGEMMQLLNNVLADATPPDRFVTLYHVDLDSQTGDLECWNAGHDPMLLWRQETQELVQVDADGMLLGVMEDTNFSPERVRMAPGDVALIFTDGLPEGMNGAREQFGFDRIRQLLRQYGDRSAAELLEAILAAHQEFTSGQPQHDDLTLILLRALPASHTAEETAS